MKKRSFLALLAASAMMLAGCVSKTTSSSSASPSGGSSGGSSNPPVVDIQPTEGKTTFYFTMSAPSELPSYTSVFLTGGFIQWHEKVGEAIEMQKQEGSNVYVGLVDELEAASTADKYYEFQLTLGYNATSGAPSTGVNWSYKSAECKAAGGDAGLDNLSFEIVNGLVNLGSHSWEEVPPDPAESAIHNLKIEAKFSAAVPEYVDLYLVGDHAKWSFDEATLMVPNAARTSFVQTLDTILGNTYGVKLMAQYHGEAADWNHTVLADGSSNYNMMVKKTWGDNYTLDLAAQAYDAMVIDTETFTIDWDEFMPELGSKVDVNVKLTAAAALNGTWEARGSWVADWSDPKALSANEGKTEFTVNLGEYAAGQKIQFKIKVTESWKVAIGNETGGNIEVNVGDEDMLVIVALDAALTTEVNEKVAGIAELAEDYTAHAAISGNGSAPAFVPADHTYGIIGIGDDWEHDIQMTPNGDNTAWTADIEYTADTTYGFHIRLDGAWDVEYGNLYLVENPGTDAKGNIQLAVGNYRVTLTFSAELVPQIAIAPLA